MNKFTKKIRLIFNKIFYKGSPGIISRKNASSEIDGYIEFYTNHYAITGPFLKIGHRAGNYKKYPQNNKIITENDVHNIKNMLDDCYNFLKLDGAEIDLQIDDKKIIDESENIYIVHDAIKGNYSDTSKEYLFKNKFSLILEYFIKKNYYKSKYLFFEIKTDKSNQLSKDGKDDKLAEKVLLIIETTIKKLNLSDKEIKILYQHISFWSFNYMILERLANLQKKAKKNYRIEVYLITATNKFFIGNIIRMLPSLQSMNYIDKKFYKKIINSKILDGICFDPATINNFAVYFNRLNDDREKNNLHRLKYIISEYKLGKDDFYKKISTQKEKLKDNEGMVFEFDCK